MKEGGEHFRAQEKAVCWAWVNICLTRLARCVGGGGWASVSGDICWRRVKVADPRLVVFVVNGGGCARVNRARVGRPS